MPEENSFGELLRQARERIGWTQQEVADKLDPPANRVTVGRWENDIQRTSAHYFKQLIDVLDLNEQEAYALYYAGGKTPPERHELPLANRFFTGREEYLLGLPKLLQEHRVVALCGLGGVGKTQIALAYAHRSHPDMYPAVLWVNAADTSTLEADYAALTETLKLPERDQVDLRQRIEAVKDWLKEHTDWLLILDNADELPIVRPFLLSKPRGHIILTTRWQFPGKIAKPLAIEALGTEEGRRFLSRRTDRQMDGAELEAADRLLELLGGHALALEHAGAFIAESGISFAGYLKLYEENRSSLLDQYGALGDENSEHPLTVAATFQTSLAAARERAPLAEDILHFCAFLQPDAIPEELFQHDDNFTSDAMAFNKGMAALQRYSLIKRTAPKRVFYWPNPQPPTFSMHRLVQAVLIDAMLPDIQKQWRARVVQALHASFPIIEIDNWIQCERLVSHVFVCAAWSEDEFTPTLEIVELFLNSGIYLRDSRHYSDAEKLLTRALSILKQHFGVEHLILRASTLNNLEVLGATHPDTQNPKKC